MRFGCCTLILGTVRQRHKLLGLLPISVCFKVAAVSVGYDDQVKPMTSRFLDVEHVSPISDVGDGSQWDDFNTDGMTTTQRALPIRSYPIANHSR
jgi:hypothetical protein